MTNYIDGYDVDILDEPPDWPEQNLGDLVPPDNIPDIGDPPDWPDDFISSEPPDDLDEPPVGYAPPEWLTHLPPEMFDAPFEQEPLTPDMSTGERLQAMGYDLEQLERDNPYGWVDPGEREITPDLEVPDTNITGDDPFAPNPALEAADRARPEKFTVAGEVLEQNAPTQSFNEWLNTLSQEERDEVAQINTEMDQEYDVAQAVTVEDPEQEFDRPLTPDEAEEMLRDIEMGVIGYRLDGSPRDDLWDNYVESVGDGTNLGGSESELIERAEAINLEDAGFVTYSNEQGHFVSAIEVAVDPASGDRYGLVLDIARFNNPEPAVSLYNELQEHVLDNTLPNYAVVDYASHVAVEMGNDPGALNWRDATEQDLFMFNMNHPWNHGWERETGLDEPPQDIWDELIQEQLGLDLAQYANEGQISDYERDPEEANLEYNLYLTANREGETVLSIAKEWDGGVRWGGGEDVRAIGVYESSELAQEVAGDIWTLRNDVEQLMGDPVSGQQAMVSYADHIGRNNGSIPEGEPIFTNESAPPNPFEIHAMEDLFAAYEEIQLQQENQHIEFDKGEEPELEM